MHINLRHDDTYFTIYGHLSEFKVQNGQFVERGQLIAKSGCTGNCQGAHVHWGLHTGNPLVSGVQSVSVNATNILARDVTANTQFQLFNSDDFIGGFFQNGVLQCGTQDGHTYASNNPLCNGGYSESYRTQTCTLPVHPEGTLIRARSDSNGTVYVLHKNDAHMADLHRDGIPTEQTLWTLYQNGGLGLQDVIAVEDGEMNSYLVGGTICQSGCSISSPLPSNGRSAPPGRLITNGSEVSIVQSDGGSRPFSSQMTFSQMGYLFCNVLTVSDYSSYLPVGQIVDGNSEDLGGAPDELGPNLSITSHNNGQTVTNSTVIISGTASDAGRGESGIASVTVNGVRANGDTASVSNTANWSRSVTLNSGSNTITVVATDNAPTPNQTSQTITLTYSTGGGTGGPAGTPLDFTWQYKQNMPTSTWGAASAVCNNQIYVFGGSAGIFNNYRYTPATNSWEQKASMTAGGISEGGAATIGTKIYVIGNWQDTRIRIYDTATDQWTTGASMSSQVRRGPNVAAVNGKIYVLGSDDFSLNGLNDVHMYDPATDTWTNKSPMPTARGFASVVVVNNLIYVIGGLDESNTPSIKQAVEVYDPASDTWSIKNPAPQPSYIAGFVAVNNRIYILGGGNGSNALNTVNEYNPAQDSWRTLSPFHTARYQHVAGTVNGKIYLIGGPDASVEEGTPTGYAPTLTVTPKSQTVYLGSFAPIWLTLSSAQATDTQVTMSSSNSGIASVSNTFFSAGSTTTSNVVWGNAVGGPVTIHVKLPDSLGGISDDISVTVINRPPNVSTTAAGTITATTTILGGDINPNGAVTNGWFEYGTDSALSSYYSSSAQLLGAGNSIISIYENLSGLAPNTTYYFRVVASNNGGTSKGSILSFVTGSPPSQTSNVALTSNGGTTTASSTLAGYPSSRVNDGDRTGATGGIWADGTQSGFPDWVEVDFNGWKTLSEIDLITLQDNYGNPTEPTLAQTFNLYGATAFDVQYWTGSAWATVPSGSVTGNNKVWRQFTFAPLTTNKVRVMINGGAGNTFSRVAELEAWGTPAGFNVALTSNGGTTVASSTLSGYPSSRVNDGDRTGATGGIWADGTQSGFPDWVEIDFNGWKTLTEIDLITLQDNYSNPTEPTLGQTFNFYGATAFDVQYWTGSAWATVPGGSVTGNNKVWRQFTFAPLTTNKVRVMINGGAGNTFSRVVELEAWGTPAGFNVALTSNGGTTGASSTLFGYPSSRVNDGDRTGATGGIWADGTQSSFPDWVEVDFNGTKTLTEIDLITLQDNYSNPTEPTLGQTFNLYGATAFDVQYWTGSTWATVPGGSVTGNNKVWRQFTFAPLTTNKVRVMINGGAGNTFSRVVELEAWAQPEP